MQKVREISNINRSDCQKLIINYKLKNKDDEEHCTDRRNPRRHGSFRRPRRTQPYLTKF